MAGLIPMDKAIAAANELALENVIERLRAVAILHRPIEQDLYAWDCFNGDCDDPTHDPECPLERVPTCRECWSIREDINDEAGGPSWPCDTIKALGGPDLALKLIETEV